MSELCFTSARRLAQLIRTRKLSAREVAIPRLIFLPYGLILSSFTLIVVERATLKVLYQRSAT